MKSPFSIVARVTALAVIVFACSAFNGCASFSPGAIKDPQTAVYAIKTDYKHALAVGAWYGSLTSCAAPEHDAVFCSDAKVVVKIGDAKNVASPALNAAEATVRNPLFDQSTTNKVVLSAQAAVAVLTAITTPLEDLLGKAVAAGKAQPLPKDAGVYYMIGITADQPMHAELTLAAILALLNALLGFVPQASAWWTQIKADRDKVQAMIDENRQPTAAEWDELNASIAGYEAQIDANTARARAELGGAASA